MREFAIGRFLFLGQSMKLRALGRDLAVFMQLVHSKIRRICQTADILGQAGATVFEQGKVVLTALPKICSHNQLCFLVHDQLRFLGMPFLLSAVVPTLFFLAVRSVARWRQSTPLRSTCHWLVMLCGPAVEIRPISSGHFRPSGWSGKPLLR